ncbi:hypothetical protein HMPREF9946_02215 [Acetobacteraceae bacterium AT-5844]|nr:hypothetical protein HMPREF9946_02215 [Acetobacteraceae bacterium AT-5844]
MPRTSPLLTAAVDHLVRDDSAPPLFIPAAHQGTIAAEAARAAEVVRSRMEPATADRWRSFLFPLMAAVTKPPAREAFDAFVVACAASLTNIPAHLLTSPRQAEAIRRFSWWPAVADIAKWLEPEAREERAMLAALERIAATPEPSAQQREATAEAIAEVKSKFAAFRREMAAQERAAAPEKPRPIYLSPAQELAEWKAIAAARPGPDGDGARRMVAVLGGLQ